MWSLLLVFFLSLAFSNGDGACGGNNTTCDNTTALPSAPSLRVFNIAPCTYGTSSVSIMYTDLWLVRKNFTNCISTANAVYRITTLSNAATVDDPIVFVTRDSTNVQTWKLPYERPDYDLTFNSSSHTICQNMITDNINSSTTEQMPDISMYIDTFTSSHNQLSYTIDIETIDIILELNERTQFVVQPNTPQLFYFKFPPVYVDVQVTTSANASGCTVISIQNASCPLNDLESNIRSTGLYQTMTTSSTITIDERQTASYDGFFIIVAMTNTINCYRENDPIASLEGLTRQNIEIIIEKQKKALDYGWAMAFPVLIFTVLGLSVSLLLGYPCVHIIFRPFTCDRPCEIYTCRSVTVHDKESEDEDKEMLMINGAATTRQLQQETTQANDNISDETDEHHIESKIKLLDLKENQVRLSHLLRLPLDSLEKQYSIYAWNTITVGVFYGLPAFQVVLTDEVIFRSSGNQDTCYFNFKCLRPLGILDAFNNLWSNIAYVILGLAFIILVAIRHCKTNQMKVKYPHLYHSYGIPQFYGIYYALGVALMLEGFMSSFYHMCPNFDVYQFDSSFMYIICGLLIVVIFQKRHPDIHANAFVAFICFAGVIFLILLGTHRQTMTFWSVRITIVILIVLIVSMVCLSFYYYHDWEMNYWIKLQTYKDIWNWLVNWCKRLKNEKSCKLLLPRHPVRFVKILIIITGNLLIGVIIAIVSHKQLAVVILAVFISNFLMFAGLYLLSKLWYREPWTLINMLSLVVLSVTWGIGFYLLLNVTAKREVTPAQSREYNQDCLLFNFYDLHDIWHFVSATALFSTFIFILTLDDGLMRTKRESIHVF